MDNVKFDQFANRIFRTSVEQQAQIQALNDNLKKVTQVLNVFANQAKNTNNDSVTSWTNIRAAMSNIPNLPTL